MLDLDVRREDEDRRLGELLADLAGRVETLRRVRRRHPDIDKGELGPVFANGCDQLLAIAAPRYDIEPGPLEEARQALAEEYVVVCQRHSRAVCAHAAQYRRPGQFLHEDMRGAR